MSHIRGEPRTVRPRTPRRCGNFLFGAWRHPAHDTEQSPFLAQRRFLMYYGLLALLTRSLRQDARQLRNHVFRLTFVGFIYLSLLWATVTSAAFGAPGLRFFVSIAWLNAVFITCAGIGFFASAITEEKEEETIGLLLMAGLNPLAILLGKSTSRLIQASMLVVVQFPFMLLAVTLGGVTPHQIISAYVALLAFMTFLANVALVWSTICERSGSAAGLTCAVLVAYALAPYAAPQISTQLKEWGLTGTSGFGSIIHGTLEWGADLSVYHRLSRIMETGFQEPVFSQQVISNVFGGIVCFAFAWAIFTPFTKDSSGGAVTRGMVLKSNSRVRFLSSGRAWPLPLVWKDFQFIAGGFGFAVVKLVAYVMLATGLVSYFWATVDTPGIGVDELYASCACCTIAIEASILAARIFYDEVRLQTLSSLLMLPRSIPYLGYSKALGCVMGLLPSVGCLLLGTILLPGGGSRLAVNALIDPMVWGFVLILMIFLHLVALLSLFVKWGALPLAIVIMVPLTPCCPIFSLLVLVAGPGGVRDSAGAFPAIATVWILIGLFCFVFQMMIASRLQEIGSK